MAAKASTKGGIGRLPLRLKLKKTASVIVILLVAQLAQLFSLKQDYEGFLQKEELGALVPAAAAAASDFTAEAELVTFMSSIVCRPHMVFTTFKCPGCIYLRRTIEQNVRRTFSQMAPSRLSFFAYNSSASKVKKNVHGVPVLGSMYQLTIQACPNALTYTYVNGDILPRMDFLLTIEAATAWAAKRDSDFFIVGRRVDVSWSNSSNGVAFDTHFRMGTLSQTDAQDYFCLTKAAVDWGNIPPFVIGRPAYDNWLVDHIYHEHPKVALIDATQTISIIHMTDSEGRKAHGGSMVKSDEDLAYNRVIGKNQWDHGTTEHAQFLTQWQDGSVSVVKSPHPLAKISPPLTTMNNPLAVIPPVSPAVVFVPNKTKTVYLRQPADFTITVLTMNRVGSLQRLLTSLETAEYGEDRVLLIIKVDRAADNTAVVDFAKSFAFSHGDKTVEVLTTNKGLRQSWLDAWIPETDNSHGIILEDDVEVSTKWYQWLRGAWQTHSEREDMAGISLQRQTLIPKKPSKQLEIVNGHHPFLYKLVGSIGFSPHPKRWQEFLEWVWAKDLDTFDAHVEGLVTSDWYKELDKKTMWTQLFLRFCYERGLYTMYVNLLEHKTLAAHWREKGEHFGGGQGKDFELVTTVKGGFPTEVVKYGWDGQPERPPPTYAEETSLRGLRRYAGTKYGGWMYNAMGLTPNSIVYSVGIGEDTSWDESIIRDHGLHVWGFDPTPKAVEYVQNNHALGSNFHFTAEGLAAEPGKIAFTKPNNPNHVSMRQGKHKGLGETIEVPVNTMERWMKANGHTHLDILKIGIEGSEYAVLEDWIRRNWFPMDQLLVEFHQRFSKDQSRHTRVLNGVRENGFEIIHDVKGQEITFQRLHQNAKSAQRIHAEHGVVILQLLNDGYVEMTKSWICNVRRFGTVLPKTLFVTTDQPSYDALTAFDPTLNVVLEPYAAPAKMEYGQTAYFNYMLFRTRLISKMLAANLTLWLTESDAVWLRNPTSLVLKTEGDLITMSDDRPPGQIFQGGFQLLRPTDATKRLWTRMHDAFNSKMKAVTKQNIGDHGSEQIMLDMMIRKDTELKVGWIAPHTFVCGLWYNDTAYRKTAHDPAVVLNNWIIGNDAKIKRAKEWKHWYLNQFGECMVDHPTNNNMTAISDAIFTAITSSKEEEEDGSSMVCSIGSPPWIVEVTETEQKIKNLKSFYEIWTRRPGGDNNEGGGFFHYFALYHMINTIQPKTIVESGTARGVGTWFLRQIAGDGVQIIVLSPENPDIYRDDINAAYLTDTKFQDFNDIDWDGPVGGFDVVDKENTLLFFDDHQAASRRIEEASKKKFKYIVFDDGYPPGNGDNLSSKKLCSPKMWDSLNIEMYNYQDNFGDVDRTMSKEELEAESNKFHSLVNIYAEFPMAWMGPNRLDIDDKKYRDINEPPLFSLSEVKELGVDESALTRGSFDEEAKKYTFINFVELKDVDS